jgi:pimeloyl-ACP methyl ester carboxylesterase
LRNEIDILKLLLSVQAPTLVLNCRHNDVSPFNEGRRMASAIPNARRVSLESANHIPMPGGPAWGTFVDSIEAFLIS